MRREGGLRRRSRGVFRIPPALGPEHSEDLLLLSANRDDAAFVSAVADAAGARSFPVRDPMELGNALGTHPYAFVFWDADGHAPAKPGAKAAEKLSDPEIQKTIRATLARIVNPLNVFILSDKAPTEYPQLYDDQAEGAACFRHHILRQYDGAAQRLCATALMTSGMGKPAGLARYFPKGTRIQRITLTKSEQRFAATEAIQSFLGKAGVTSRLAPKAAQAVDELIMNAIFDAPRDKKGKPTREMTDRAAKFDLGAADSVDVQAAFTDEYVGICVTDRYGSLVGDTVMRYLSQDFRSHDYKVRTFKRGAGLGLYGVVNSGLSLILSCQAKSRTDAMILFPNARTYKAFKNGFQFSFCFAG